MGRYIYNDLKTLPHDSDEETDESDESDKKAYDKEQINIEYHEGVSWILISF